MFIYFWLGLGFLFPLSTSLGTAQTDRVCVLAFLFLFLFNLFLFFIFYCFFSRSCVLFTRPISLFFNKIFIKNRSYGTIHTFKNYFTIMFSIFSKISGIQTHSKCIYIYIYIFDKFQFMNMKYH